MLRGGGRWEELEISAAVRAVVLLNLQSYGGGRDLWGKHNSEVRTANYPLAASNVCGSVRFKGDPHGLE